MRRTILFVLGVIGLFVVIVWVLGQVQRRYSIRTDPITQRSAASSWAVAEPPPGTSIGARSSL